jgi:hypothetical protein
MHDKFFEYFHEFLSYICYPKQIYNIFHSLLFIKYMFIYGGQCIEMWSKSNESNGKKSLSSSHKKKNPYGEYDKPLRHLSLLCHIFKGAYLL